MANSSWNTDTDINTHDVYARVNISLCPWCNFFSIETKKSIVAYLGKEGEGGVPLRSSLDEWVGIS